MSFKFSSSLIFEKKSKNKKVANFNIFNLTQYVQNIVISTRNQ